MLAASCYTNKIEVLIENVILPHEASRACHYLPLQSTTCVIINVFLRAISNTRVKYACDSV